MTIAIPKASTHVRAALAASIVVFIGYMIKQPQMVAWLQAHWFWSDVFTGIGVAYGVYTTYSQPSQFVQQNPAIGAKL